MVIVHLSYLETPKYSGIYFYIKNIVEFQNKLGIKSYWLTSNKDRINKTSKAILEEIQNFSPDIIHIHGLWRKPTRLINKLLKISKNVIVSPHGMLNKYSFNKSSYKKKLALLFYEKNNLQKIKYFHSLNNYETKNIQKYFPNISIKEISAGINIQKNKPKIISLKWKNLVKEKEKIILFLGRLESCKGIDELISAWNELSYKAKKYGWWLLIVGYGSRENFIKKNSQDITNRIIYQGEAYGDVKNYILNIANSFILPSISEGIPIAALEALSFKTLCLLTNECNLGNLKSIDASIEIKKEKKDIKANLNRMFLLSEDELNRKSNLGLDYVKNNHNWEKISKQTIDLYEKIINNSEKKES